MPGFIRLTALRVVVVLAFACCACGQAATPSAAANDTPFAPFEQWKDLVLKGDSDGLKGLYSAHPVAHVQAGSSELDAWGEVRFWVGVKAKSMNVKMLPSGTAQVQPGAKQVLFQAEVLSAVGPKDQTYYITEGQLWQQQDQQWRILVVKRTEASRLEQPTSNQKNIYPAEADAHAEIKEAMQKARKEHKRVLLVFGANWCYDCHVLDLAFARPDVAPILGSSFEVVHVDIGQGDKNQDLMKDYDVPMERGIPAIAVLGEDGKILYSQKNGEFEKARSLGPEDVLAFLNKWKPQS